jgi:hypothetical protein
LPEVDSARQMMISGNLPPVTCSTGSASATHRRQRL